MHHGSGEVEHRTERWLRPLLEAPGDAEPEYAVVVRGCESSRAAVGSQFHQHCTNRVGHLWPYVVCDERVRPRGLQHTIDRGERRERGFVLDAHCGGIVSRL